MSYIRKRKSPSGSRNTDPMVTWVDQNTRQVFKHCSRPAKVSRVTGRWMCHWRLASCGPRRSDKLRRGDIRSVAHSSDFYNYCCCGCRSHVLSGSVSGRGTAIGRVRPTCPSVFLWTKLTYNFEFWLVHGSWPVAHVRLKVKVIPLTQSQR